MDADQHLRRDMNRWNNRVALAAVLIRERERRGLTRAQLAAASAVPEDLIREVEQAERDSLTNDQVEALASALGTTWSAISHAARDRARQMREDQ